MSEEAPSWSLLQIAELLRTGDDLLLPRLAALHAVTPELANGDEIAVAADEAAELRMLAEALAEVAGRLQTLIEDVPDGELGVAYGEVAAGAAEDLGRGIIDPARALLAARVLDVATGWRALAHALRNADTHAAWERTTIAGLLGRFRGVDERTLRRVLAAAEIDADAAFAACDEHATARLAAALEEHAPAERC
ncbi:MAG TPA: hypothetical protein VE972_01875 [Conexibacter sp.]|nr:hypothetical protein [Conexibacter sp.]